MANISRDLKIKKKLTKSSFSSYFPANNKKRKVKENSQQKMRKEKEWRFISSQCVSKKEDRNLKRVGRICECLKQTPWSGGVLLSDGWMTKHMMKSSIEQTNNSIRRWTSSYTAVVTTAHLFCLSSSMPDKRYLFKVAIIFTCLFKRLMHLFYFHYLSCFYYFEWKELVCPEHKEPTA